MTAHAPFTGDSRALIAAAPRLSREHALQLIAKHGWQPNEPTVFWPEENRPDPDSTFDAELGVHDSYSTEAIFDWLGY